MPSQDQEEVVMGNKHKDKGKWRDREEEYDDFRTGYMGGGGRTWAGPGPMTTTATKEPVAPPDPTIIAAVTDTRIYTGPETLEGLTKPLTLLITGKGLMSVRHTPIGRFIGAAKDSYSPLPGLPSPEVGVHLNIPKLPWASLCQVVAFFREVNRKRNGSEALVQFFWDPAAQRYVAHVPPQEVSGGGVHHQGHHDKEGDILHVLDIHSHGNMGAFWSGTDDADEKRFEGRLFGVIGKNDQLIPEMKWRARIGGAFLDLTIEEVVETPAAVEVTVTETFNPMELLRVAGGSNSKGNTKFTFSFDPFKDATFPAAWEDALKDPFVGAPRGQGSLAEQGFVQTRPGVWTRLIQGCLPTSSGWRTTTPHGDRRDTPGGAAPTDGPASSTISPDGSGRGAGTGGTNTYRPVYALDRLSGKVYYVDHEGFYWPTVRTAEEVAKSVDNVVMRLLAGPPPEDQLGPTQTQDWRR